MSNRKTYLVTGGSSGVGKAIATGIAQTGANVIIVSRSEANGAKAVKEITEKSGNKHVSFLTADLSLMKSVHQLSERFRKEHRQLDGLVNAAGAWFFKKEITSEGIDKSFAVNYLCHFALTTSLLDLLKATEGSRIVTVGGNPRFLKKPKIDLNDLELTKSYGGFKSAGQTMFERIYFGFELSDRLKDTSVSSILFHPGFVKSNLASNSPWWGKLLFQLMPSVRNAPETCESGVYVATLEHAKSYNGQFIDDNNQPLDMRPNFDRSIGKELWALSEKMVAKK